MGRQPIRFRFCLLIGAEELRGGRQEFQVRRLISKFLRDQSGATAIEYCLIATGIAFVIIAVVNGIGSSLSGTFTSVNGSLK